MKLYVKQSSPYIVPTDDDKRIEEHFGVAGINAGDFSIAHMVVPPGWTKPHQTPEFDEITMMVRGRKRIEIDGDVVELAVGESLLIRRGARVRYSNPFDEEAEYWALCMPAFTLERAHRE